MKVSAELGGRCRREVKFTRGQFVLFHKGSRKVRQLLDRAEPGAANTKKRFILYQLEGKVDKKTGNSLLSTCRGSSEGALEI